MMEEESKFLCLPIEIREFSDDETKPIRDVPKTRGRTDQISDL